MLLNKATFNPENPIEWKEAATTKTYRWNIPISVNEFSRIAKHTDFFFVTIEETFSCFCKKRER